MSEARGGGSVGGAGAAPGEEPGRKARGSSELDVSRIRTVPVQQRANKVAAEQFARPPESRSPGTPVTSATFSTFLDSLPDILAARSFRAVARAMEQAHRDGRAVVCMMGGHVIKTGLSPVLIDLMERGVITHLASNGATIIHDYELARWGGTSEDVEAGLGDGTFGMAEETGGEMNRATVRGAGEGWGLGESIARRLEDAEASGDLAEPELSLLLAARRLGVEFTVHASVGAEIIHQHPEMDGAALGATSYRDFRRLAGALRGLEGGVVLNLGSAVLMPEVFLKALTMCRNVHDGAPRKFVAADFDMIRHYRPRMNVVERPTRTGGGKGYQITGHHEIMVPLLAWAVVEELEGSK